MEYADPFQMLAMITLAIGKVKIHDTGEIPKIPIILLSVPLSANSAPNMNAAMTSGVIQPKMTVKPTNLRSSRPFFFISEASRNPSTC